MQAERSAVDRVLKCFALDGVAISDVGEDEIRAARAELEQLRRALNHALYRTHAPSTGCAGCNDIDQALRLPPAEART